jgi:hypothetical protein
VSTRRRPGKRGSVRASGGLALALLTLIVPVAQAELSSTGNLFVTFEGGILPDALPRHERAPITVWMAGKVRTLSGEQPPSLKEVSISLNREGHLETLGLPTCRRGQIELESTADALAACGPALVGKGSYRARTTFPEQSQSPSHGKILAFNARVGGRSVILGHVYGSQPAPSTGIIEFKIRHTAGTYGTVLTGTVPASLSRWGYLKRISLRLHRNYTYRGRARTYLSAPCPAPSDLDHASFPFVFTSLSFEDGRTLSAHLTRTCRVKAGS